MNFEFKFALYFGYLVPVGVLLVVNFLIIYKATQFSRSHRNATNLASIQSEKKKSQMTRTILVLTFIYIAFTLPEQIYAGYVYVYVSQFYIVQMMSNIITFIQLFYPSFHIFILLWSNKQFAIEIKSIVSMIKMGNRVSDTSSHVLNNSAINFRPS